MKLKSLFLGTAAGVMAVTGAQAADLTVTEPVEYVRVCDLYGTGYYYIPGTDTCLKIGGYVRFETRVLTTHTRNDDLLQFFARGQVEFDARTQTEFGLLRSFIAIQANRGPNGGDDVHLDKGYIQFAGLTAGYATSFFELSTGFNYDNPAVVSDRSLPLIAYTAAFGNGISATLSFEDRTYRESGLGVSVGAPVAPGFYAYGGQSMPDIVANVRVDQGWGTAQVMGALHQIRGGVGFGTADTDYGWALGAGVQVNLPMLAPGDKILLEGTYVDGAVRYMNQGSIGPIANFIPAGLGTAVTPDAVLNATGTGWKKTTGWGVLAGIQHYWSPTLRSNVTAGYGQIDIPTLPFVNWDLDYDYWRVGVNTIWSPVAGLDIGVEALYTNYSYDANAALVAATGGAASPFDDSFDEWSGKLRIQRNF